MSKHFGSRLKVFLCYASDDKAVAVSLYRSLSNEGVDVWFDEEKLLPGQDWDFEISNAIRGSHAVIVCLTKNSVSKEGYVQKEIKRALDFADEKPEETIFVIPIKFDNCDIPIRQKCFDNNFCEIISFIGKDCYWNIISLQFIEQFRNTWIRFCIYRPSFCIFDFHRGQKFFD